MRIEQGDREEQEDVKGKKQIVREQEIGRIDSMNRGRRTAEKKKKKQELRRRIKKKRQRKQMQRKWKKKIYREEGDKEEEKECIARKNV